MRLIPFGLALFVLLLLGACAQHPPRPIDDPWLAATAGIDPVEVSEFMRLPAPEKARRRTLAEEGLQALRLWNPRRYEGMMLDFEMDTSPTDLLTITRRKRDGADFDDAMRICRRAAEIDPTHARVRYELGRIGAETGDWARARIDLEAAWEALPRDPRAQNDPLLEQHLILAGAWLCHDLGLWEDGLAWLDRHAGAWDAGTYQEQMLVRGLLQAGAGLFTEAYMTSLRLPPLRYRSGGMFTRGLSRRQAGYGARWIQAMNWHHQGEHALAIHALGTPASARVHIPHMTRYWTDVALLYQKSGDIAETRLDCALSLLGRAPMLYYLPIEGFSFPPVLFGQPDVTVPFMTIHQDRFVAGSLFSYACQMMADCSTAIEDPVRMRCGGLALEAFSACRRRGDRPVLAQALRGRTRFYMGQGGAALPDLLAAHAAFADSGRVDAVTSTVIGTVLMLDNSPAEALPYLAEAVEADPELAVAWQTYGVTLARVNRHDEADAAMDRAVALNPYAVGGWFNRGLHHLNLKRFAAAQADLLVAERIDRDNPQIRLILDTLAESWEEADDTDRRAVADARADSVQAALAAGEGLAAETPDGLAVTDGRRLYDLADVDFAARVDSLDAAYAEDPDPHLRESLAEALLRADRAEEALALLAPYWLTGLSPLERRLVLQADRDLGRADRARSLAAGLPDTTLRDPEMEFWTLVALICIDHGDRELGLRALDRAVALAPANTALTSFRRMIARGE